MHGLHSLLISGLLVYVAAAAATLQSSLPFRPFDLPQFCSQIITDQCNTTFASIDEINRRIRPVVSELVKSDYFRHFKLDLEKQCKFWNAQHFCATQNCAVEVLELPQYNWSNVAEDLKPSHLGKINRTDSRESPEVTDTCEDFDYCHIDDGHQCVFVDLVSNPERFTGYGGSQSFAVWRAIYAENCFPNTVPMLRDPSAPVEQCLVKNVFYRLVSGMHASISVHLSNEYLCADTGEFYASLKTFMERVGTHNDRLANIYFNYALVSEALVKLNQVVPLRDFVASRNELVSLGTNLFSSTQYAAVDASADDVAAGDTLVSELIPGLASNTLLDTSALFTAEQQSVELKNEFRLRFKNISAIMDCVGCDRCRMWGKVQTMGYGTALKILFETNDAFKLRFRRIEIVALVNTFDRLSKSVEAINNFKTMYIRHKEKVQRGEALPGDYEADLSSEGLAFPFAKLGKPEMSLPILDTGSAKRKIPPKKPVAQKAQPKVVKTGWQKFVGELKQGVDEVYVALKFVLNSYVQFPRIMLRLLVEYLSRQWDAFIGRPLPAGYKSPLGDGADSDTVVVN